ncbi:MAG: Asp-tRNA(Asn)/Glu-tRNA(Gln) amidotransferase subunit GatB [Bacillota bacterium]|nr:Asp-tRNA(Asn)/Glu-tRNA(Gln) amidotransferase subunit GatB [Bacillota bacterium]
MEYEVTVGVEVHVELNTKTKIFCHCPTTFGAEPNSQTCPVCLGLPGVLPVLNKTCVEYAMMAAIAVGGEIAPYSKFDRKNYFYPDLPKGFQISQFDLPLALGGAVEIGTPEAPKKVRIRRIHLEEDAGKLVHATEHGTVSGAATSLVDYNRCGVPLIEIVTEPDMSSAEEARVFLNNLKDIIQYLGISDCKMEEGSLRCDANVSIKPKGRQALGVPVELKNMGSFRAVARAIEHEVGRQSQVLDAGGQIKRETRRFDEDTGATMLMRQKEATEDYRYFPEPDLVPVRIDERWKEEVRKRLPELPDAKRRRFVQEYGLPEYDAGVLVASQSMAGFFEDCVNGYGNPKAVANWVMGELMRYLNVSGKEIGAFPVTPEMLAAMLKLVDAGTISGKIAKSIFDEMCQTGKSPARIVEEKGLTQISDAGELASIVERVIAANLTVVQDFRAGKEKALGFLVGQVMKETKGRANPGLVNKMLKDKIG